MKKRILVILAFNMIGFCMLTGMNVKRLLDNSKKRNTYGTSRNSAPATTFADCLIRMHHAYVPGRELPCAYQSRNRTPLASPTTLMRDHAITQGSKKSPFCSYLRAIIGCCCRR